MASKYDDMTVDELQDRARDKGISGVSDMRKAELIDALEGEGGGSGDQTSDSIKYSQEITSVDQEPERPGRSLYTRNPEVIKRWAEERNATPATVPGTEQGDHLGVLRFDFPGYGGQDLRHVSWEEWLNTFEERGLNFIYQEQTSDGLQSNFFRLENPDREDA